MERLTTEQQAELVARAKRGDIRDLLTAMRPILKGVLFKRFSHLHEGLRDIHADAEEILMRWLAEGETSTKVRVNEPLGILAWRVLAQAAKNWVRARKAERRKRGWGRLTGLFDPRRPNVRRQLDRNNFDPRRSDETFGITAADALKLIESLSETYREALLTEAERLLNGDTRSLATILGVTPVAARFRLARARREFTKLFEEAGDV
jgi:DNA-directed RNA polymerase specialized sigma24 family protein